MLEEFEAQTLYALGNTLTPVSNFNGQMAICAEEAPIIITKEQVMKFFGLVEPESKPIFTCRHLNIIDVFGMEQIHECHYYSKTDNLCTHEACPIKD